VALLAAAATDAPDRRAAVPVGQHGLPEPVLRQLAAKAGFTQVWNVEMDNSFNKLYELAR